MPEAALNNYDPSLDADLLRQEKKKAKGGEGADGTDETTEKGGRLNEIREQIAKARQALDIKQKLKEKMQKKVAAPVQQATNRLLRWAWINLVPSFGLTLIYINIHVFLGKAIGENFFCKLGDEWKSKVLEAGGLDTAEAFSGPSKMIGIVERMGLAFLDLAVGFVILGFLSLIVMIVTFMGASIWEKVELAWKAINALGWGAVQVLINIFK